MSQQRIQQVVDFPTPTISKHLKSVLGIANYFRDHHSMVVISLHMLLSNYCKTKKVTWTVEAVNTFQQIKKEILKCTTMHFLTDNHPIYLHTDASDYGIGGYLFQLIDGKANRFCQQIFHISSTTLGCHSKTSFCNILLLHLFKYFASRSYVHDTY
jgi:RNase H-like domain found in reverse transcriptase